MKTSNGRFMSRKDLIITPSIWLLTLSLPLVWIHLMNQRQAWSLFFNTVIYVFSVVAVTLAVMKVIRMIVPLREGIYRLSDGSPVAAAWNIHGFLAITNLSFQANSALIPPPFRKFFYQLLGATM